MGAMGSYDFQNDFQNDAARKNYEASMSGENRKGVDFFEKPHLWDEERPCDIKDTPRENFVPIPTLGTGDAFKSYSVGRKIAMIAVFAMVAALVIYCGVTFFMDGGGKVGTLGESPYPFW